MGRSVLEVKHWLACVAMGVQVMGTGRGWGHILWQTDSSLLMGGNWNFMKFHAYYSRLNEE